MAQNKRKRGNKKGMVKVDVNSITDMNLELEQDNPETTNNNTNTNTTTTTVNEKKPINQKNENRSNKKRKLNKANKSASTIQNQLKEQENEWKNISTVNIPEMPEEITISNTKKNNKNKNRNKNKNKKNGNNNNKTENNTKDVEMVNLKDIDNWGWSEVKYDRSLLDAEDMGGFLSLEEITDVDVVYEEGQRGKMIKFMKQKSKNNNNNTQQAKKSEEEVEFINMDDFDWEKEKEIYKNGKLGEIRSEDSEDENIEEIMEEELNGEEDKIINENENVEEMEIETVEEKESEVKKDNENINNEKTSQNKDKKNKKAKKENNNAKKEDNKVANVVENNKKEEVKKETDEIDEDFDISAWKEYSLCPEIEKALKFLKFSKPTEIQSKTLNLALKDKRDIIGAAETGSGKTLSFGLPIIQHIATTPKAERNYCSGLILTPTRELALQVKQHLSSIAKYTDALIVPIVGGMSAQKQKRLIHQNPDLIIATPGRLWELMSDYKEFAQHLKSTRFLVLDEADRMLESGHFRELEFILNIISKKRNIKNNEEAINFRRQISVYSATLISDEFLHERIKKNNKTKNNITFGKK